MDLYKKFSPRSFDWVLAVAMFLLLGLSLAAIYSVDLSRGTELVLFKKQALAIAVGFILFVVASATQRTWFRTYAKYWYAGALLLLILVLFLGATIRGTRGWFVLEGFSFQPVELAKLGVIMMLAYVIANFSRRFERPLFFVGTAVLAGFAGVLVMLQPDFGSVVIIGSVWFGLMLLVGARRRQVLLFVGAALLVSVAAWLWLLKPYQKDRVFTFINPQRDALGAGYNSTQATIAIGAGEFFGRGLGFGSQSQLRFLPEAQTDFIFSVIAEELGFVGAVALIICYGVMLWRLTQISARSPDDFSATVVAGIAILFFVQFMLIVGANLGLLPITGVTLPLVSYGGSSLVVSMLMLGMAESMVEKKY